MRRRVTRVETAGAHAWWVACLCALTLYLPGAWVHAATSVVLVSGESSATYEAVADAFGRALAGRHPLRTRLLDEMSEGELSELRSGENLVVTVGVRARRVFSGARAPRLSLLVPRGAEPSTGAGRESMVYIDPPPERYLRFVKALLPQAGKIGVVVSDAATESLAAFRAQAGRLGLQLEVESAREQDDVPMALQRLLGKVDVLLLLPDQVVVNERSIRYILIASYRNRVPVVGFSRAMAHAGALAALVSGPDEIGRQGGLLASAWNPETGFLPPPRHAERHEVHFNRQVARSLGIVVPASQKEEAALRAVIEAVGAGR